MATSKTVMVVHPDSAMRILLRSILRSRGRAVVTGDSWLDLISDRSGACPGVILLDRSLLDRDKGEVLSLIRQKWTDAEVVFLPDGLADAGTRADGIVQLLGHVDRLLTMQSTRDLLAVPHGSR